MIRNIESNLLRILLILIYLTIVSESNHLNIQRIENDLKKAKQMRDEPYTELLDRSCDFQLFKDEMIPKYWIDVFKQKTTETILKDFKLRHWKVSVEFEPNENVKQVKGYIDHKSKNVTAYTVKRTEQEAFERSICSYPGGLLECSPEGKCVCLGSANSKFYVNSSVPKTTRVDPDTGEPNPAGNGCYVKPGWNCYTNFLDDDHSVKGIELPCVGLQACNDMNGHKHFECRSAGNSLLPFSVQHRMLHYTGLPLLVCKFIALRLQL